MSRLAIALLIGLCFVPQAVAALAARSDPFNALRKDLSGVLAKPLGTSKAGSLTQVSREEFTVTDQTEVTLDGRPCRYKDVPPGASILRIELAPDQKTILRIHFRTRK